MPAGMPAVQSTAMTMSEPLHRSTTIRRANGAALCLAGLVVSTAAWAAPFALIVNGDPMSLNPAPLIEAGDVLLPASVLSHRLGIAVMPTEPKGMWVVSAYGQRIFVRANTTRYMAAEGEKLATHPPRMQGGEMHIPSSTLAANFDLDITRPTNEQLSVTSAPAEVTDIRYGAHEDWARIVIDVSAPTLFSWEQTENAVIVSVPAPENVGVKRFRALTFPDELVPEVAQEPMPDGGTKVVIGHRSPTQALVFTLTDPHRIVLDFPRVKPDQPGPAQAPEQLAYRRASAWTTNRLATGRGTTIVFSLLLPVSSGTIALKPALATGTVNGKSTVGRIARRHGAYGAINGGFFASNGSPLGMLMIDGEWIKEPILGRTVLGIMQDGSLQMGNVRFAGKITLPGAGTFNISKLNTGHSQPDEVILYSGRWGHATPEKTDRVATRVMLAANGQVLRVNTEGRGMVIPDGGWVLSAVGPRRADMGKATVGGVAQLQLDTSPSWPGLRHAIGGGPRLVANGQPHVTATTESFRSDVAASAAPRSALAVMPNGDVLFVVADGRQSNYSAGLTLGELALFLVKQGVKDAINLDGGGSTTLVVGGGLVNRPCDGCERSVSNALLAFKVAPEVTAGQ